MIYIESPTNEGNGATAGYLSLPNEDFSSWNKLHLIELLERSPMGIQMTHTITKAIVLYKLMTRLH